MAHSSSARLANIVGAFGLAISDTVSAATDECGSEALPAVAISLIAGYPGLTVKDLARGLALTHSGAVRLVDRMVADGLVTREASTTDGRVVTLRLLERGERANRTILSARAEALSDALASLPNEERETFGRLCETLLAAMVRDLPQALRTCRLCDHEACEDCPIDDDVIATKRARP